MSRKKDPAKAAAEVREGRALQETVLRILGRLDPDRLYKDRAAFLRDLKKAETAEGTTLTAPLRKTPANALSERDEDAPVCKDSQGHPEPDSDLRDNENIPLVEDIHEYLAREVLPHVPDAWVDESRTKVGYEIPFTRHFYENVPPRPLEEIEGEIRALESEIQGMLSQVFA